MIATTMNSRAMMPRITASIVRPDDLSADPLVELTIPPSAGMWSSCISGGRLRWPGRSRRCPPTCQPIRKNLPATGTAGTEEVTDDILTETLGRRLQHAPAVPSRYIVNERAEPGVIRQH